ncbi:hypothetical protein MUK42_36606 [Musa troglodytarum]|uniref:Uncharacterized protein n=1 Tax=Musa troglodytarum TaxID=320322 RepID=A0A9E7KJJ9_9LILI|nr:hypothetical protein MUK42_36606 [Musa troglodytarum]
MGGLPSIGIDVMVNGRSTVVEDNPVHAVHASRQEHHHSPFYITIDIFGFSKHGGSNFEKETLHSSSSSAAAVV